MQTLLSLPISTYSHFLGEALPNCYLLWKRRTAANFYRLGNIYLLLALAGISVLYTTTEAKVVRNYVRRNQVS